MAEPEQTEVTMVEGFECAQAQQRSQWTGGRVRRRGIAGLRRLALFLACG
jgi:hypothetical protein